MQKRIHNIDEMLKGEPFDMMVTLNGYAGAWRLK